MNSEKDGRATWRRWICKLIGHSPRVRGEKILDGEDYVEASIACERCGAESEQLLEYNEVRQP